MQAFTLTSVHWTSDFLRKRELLFQGLASFALTSSSIFHLSTIFLQSSQYAAFKCLFLRMYILETLSKYQAMVVVKDGKLVSHSFDLV